jgi:peptidoglycan/LPS O-acetylase OafA/YrhL
MTIYQESPRASPRRRRRIAALMVLEAASLLVASLLHLSGFAHGHARPFTATGAGIAEAVIGIVVACGAVSLLRPGARGRGTALAVTAFAIIGVVYGLSITTQGGDLRDIVYHATLLPMLIATFALLLRQKRRREQRGAGDFQLGVRPGP